MLWHLFENIYFVVMVFPHRKRGFFARERYQMVAAIPDANGQVNAALVIQSGNRIWKFLSPVHTPNCKGAVGGMGCMIFFKDKIQIPLSLPTRPNLLCNNNKCFENGGAI
jgi:hypothetical protein